METDLRIPVNQSINADNMKANEAKSECVDPKKKKKKKKKRERERERN